MALDSGWEQPARLQIRIACRGDGRCFFERRNDISLNKRDIVNGLTRYKRTISLRSWKAGTDNPDNGALATSGNWECVYGAENTANDGMGSKLVPLVKIECNSPYDLTLGA